MFRRSPAIPLTYAPAPFERYSTCGHQRGSEPTHLEAHLTLVTWARKIDFNFLKEPMSSPGEARVRLQPGCC
jgi:hypothetical protein